MWDKKGHAYGRKRCRLAGAPARAGGRGCGRTLRLAGEAGLLGGAQLVALEVSVWHSAPGI